ncbi:MAG: uridine kinase [Spirochaetes bacterium]|nr:uridine kinase [Spirochaetota bacterium]
MEKTIFIGIAGGSASGKTTIAQEIIKPFKKQELVILEQDAYYKELSHLTLEERKKANFDHPNSVDIELLVHHIAQLRNGNSILKPIYDFTRHTRKPESIEIQPTSIIVVDGILIFAIPEIRKLFDIKIFVDTDSDVRLLRRISRDITERGRAFESIKEQYLNTVKPMYEEFIEPSKRYADIIIPRGGKNRIGINMVISKIRSLINQEMTL